MFFTRRSLYTEQLLHEASITEQFLHTDACSNSGYYIVDTKALSNKRLLHTAIFLHREAFTQSSFYTPRPLHTEAFDQKSLTEKELSTEAFTHRSSHSQGLSHSFYTEKKCKKNPLHQAAVTHRSIYTEKPLHTGVLHTETFTRRSQYTEQL